MENQINLEGGTSRQSEQINELAGALCEAQKQIGFAEKTSNNPFFKSRYADLASVWNACREPLTNNGLCVTQLPNGLSADGGVRLTTKLLHKSGQWISSEIIVNASRKAGVAATPHELGSAISYARRYSLAAIVGVIQADDDGNAASGKCEVRQAIEQIDENEAEQLDVSEILKRIKSLSGGDPVLFAENCKKQIAKSFDQHGKQFSVDLKSVLAREYNGMLSG